MPLTITLCLDRGLEIVPVNFRVFLRRIEGGYYEGDHFFAVRFGPITPIVGISLNYVDRRRVMLLYLRGLVFCLGVQGLQVKGIPVGGVAYQGERFRHVFHSSVAYGYGLSNYGNRCGGERGLLRGHCFLISVVDFKAVSRYGWQSEGKGSLKVGGRGNSFYVFWQTSMSSSCASSEDSSFFVLVFPSNRVIVRVNACESIYK